MPENVRVSNKNVSIALEKWNDFISKKNPFNFYNVLRSIDILRKYKDVDEKYLNTLMDLKEKIINSCDFELKVQIRAINQNRIYSKFY